MKAGKGKKPSQRTVTVAQKILRSQGYSPARLYNTDNLDDAWTLQWSELAANAWVKSVQITGPFYVRLP